MLKAARIIRCVVATFWLAPFILLAFAIVPFNGSWTEIGNDCNFGQCWSTGKWDPWFFLVFLFPPAWASVIVLHLRTSRNLSWGQYLWSSLFSLLMLLVFNLVWTAFLLNFSIQQVFLVGLWHPLTWLMFLVTLQGYVILWFAAYEALRFLPRPLGIAGRDEWDKPARV